MFRQDGHTGFCEVDHQDRKCESQSATVPWFRAEKESAAPVLLASSDGMNLNLPHLPSSLPWEDGKWNSRGDYESSLEKLEEAILLHEKMGFPAPMDIQADEDILAVHNKLVREVREHLLGEDHAEDALHFQEDRIIVSLWESGMEFLNINLWDVFERFPVREERDFVFRLLSYLLHEMGVAYVPYESYQVIEIIEEAKLDGDPLDSCFPTGSGAIGPTLGELAFDAQRALCDAYFFSFMDDLDTNNIKHDLKKSNVSESFKCWFSDVLSACYTIGDFFKYYDPDNQFSEEGEIFIAVLFCIETGQVNLMDEFVDRFGTEILELGENNFQLSFSYEDNEKASKIQKYRKAFKKLDSFFRFLA
jgi:hypothetical protein